MFPSTKNQSNLTSQVLLTVCLSRALYNDFLSKCSCFSLDLDAAEVEIYHLLLPVILGQQKSHMSIGHQRTAFQWEAMLVKLLALLYHSMIMCH